MSCLCLNMIVKNEAPILRGCLESVVPWISHYVIGDTGSTDGTQELVRTFFDEHGIPGEIHSFVFEDFSQARNRALEFCRASSGNFTHILFTDADMELVVEDPSFRERLNDKAMLVRQRAGISYDNLRILPRNLAARYVGATHEYVAHSGEARRLEGIWFLDHANGSSRSEKSERDARLLESDLQNNPHDARSTFYLAQTFKDMGRHADAIARYRERVALGGWDEEVWYASYMIAHCLKELGDEPGFVHQALTAFQMRPSRSEPLHLLATYYRCKGKNDLAMLFTETGLRIPLSKDRLFVEDFAYRYGFRQELSIAGFYARDPEVRERAYEACMSLATDNDVPCFVQDVAIRNTVHYARSAEECFGAIDIQEIVLDRDPSDRHAIYSSMNPSIAALPNGETHCIVRTVNYVIEDGRYVIRSPDRDLDNVVRTENVMIELDADLSIRSQTRLRDQVTEGRRDFVVLGYEDCRLFHCRGQWWASATVRDRHPSGNAEIAILELVREKESLQPPAASPEREESGSAGQQVSQSENWIVTKVHVQRNIHPELHQKNWIPLVNGDDLFFIYSSDPTVILAFDFQSMTCREHARLEPDIVMGTFRGSSQALPLVIDGESGWVFVVHEAFGMGTRRYTHRLVWMDRGFEIHHVSDPFYFIKQGIEFCAGLASVGDRWVFSFGVDDARAYLGSVSQKNLMEWLLTGIRRRS